MWGLLKPKRAEVRNICRAARGWKKGDRAYVEMEVTGTYGPGGKYVNLYIPGVKPSVVLPANLLKEIA